MGAQAKTQPNTSGDLQKVSQDVNPIQKFKVKLTLTNGVRVLIGIICLLLFIDHARRIIIHYLNYDTIVTLSCRPPNQTILPGITVCAPMIIDPEKVVIRENDDEFNESFNRFKRSLLERENENAEEEFDLDQQDKEKRKKKELDFTQMYMDKQKYLFKTYPAVDILANYTVDVEKLIHRCVVRTTSRVKPKHGIECEKIAPYYKFIYDNRICFTIFSSLVERREQYKNLMLQYDDNPSIELFVDEDNDNWQVTDSPDKVIATVHPPTVLPTQLEVDFFTLQSVYWYDVRYTKTEARLKEAPYTTNCKDYGDGRFDPEGQLAVVGQRTENDCLNSCVANQTVSYNDSQCFNYYGIVTECLIRDNKHLNFCLPEKQDYEVFVSARRNCTGQCQQNCSTEWYEFQVVEIVNDDQIDRCPTSKPINTNATLECDSKVMIKLQHSSIMKITHQEAVTQNEFIGTLGAHAGIWLGLSLVTVFNLVISAVEAVIYSCRRKKSDEKQVAK